MDSYSNYDENSSDDSDVGAMKLVNAIFNPLAALDTLEKLEEDEQNKVESSIARAPRRYLHRDRVGASERLWQDYFSDSPTFSADYFRRRFRMSKSLFVRICQGITSYSHQSIPPYFGYFHQKLDAASVSSFNVFQRCTSVVRQLAYGCVTDMFDEYLQMGQQTSYLRLENFCKCVFHLYSTEYLRRPTLQDIQRLHVKHQELHGFPGMLGSIDCMHWPWKNCLVAWNGQYTRGDQGWPTIILEAVALYDLWIWHAYFGPIGSNNNINVLNQSDLFDDLLEDRTPEIVYDLNEVQLKKGHYLADWIYPEWATLVKSFKCSIEAKTMKFKRFQESARKDIERAFGVLQGRWGILKSSARLYSVNMIRIIMYTCVILHNMIVRDNGHSICLLEEDYLSNSTNFPHRSFLERVQVHIRMDKELRDSRSHHKLHNALIEHIWNLPENYRVRNN